ncbi:MAG: chaperone NapD [Gimesia sp.]
MSITLRNKQVLAVEDLTMNISSMVITLVDNVAEISSIEETLAGFSCIEIGQRHGCKIPIVLEAENDSDSREWFHRISQLPGVLKVEVAFVSFEDLNPVECQEVESQE